MSSTSTESPRSDLRRLWRTRPVRTPDESKIAGVCGGIGRRYGVDPVLVRVAFVVAALWGGAGVFVYALAWLLLRSPGDEVSMGEALLGRGRSSGSRVTAILLVIVALVAAPTFGGSGEGYFVGAGLIMVAALLAGWYGLYRRTPTPPAGWAEVSSAPPAPGDPRSTDPSATAATAATAAHRPPPAWDPLGAAPFAWDLPDPGTVPPPAPAPQPRSRLTKVTLGLAIITVAVCTGLARFAGLTWLTATTIAAIALAVVAAGLLAGAVTRRGHGLLVVAGPLAGFVLLSSLVTPADLASTGGRAHGDLRVPITTVDQLDTPIIHEFGDLEVDLRGLTLDHDRDFSVSTDVGTVTVRLPRDLDVRVECRTDVGSLDCPTGSDPGPDGPGGPVLTLDVRSDVGSVEVTR